MEPPGMEKGWTHWEGTGLIPGEGGTRSGDPARFLLTFSYSSSSGLCFCSQSASGRSLKEPVTPCSTWILRRVSALGIISTMPGSRDSRVRHIHPAQGAPRPQPPFATSPATPQPSLLMFLQMDWWDQIRRWITATRSSSSLAEPQDLPCRRQPESIATWGLMPPGTPDAGLPRPRPVEKQRKMTMRMSSPSCTQILFMIRIICSVSMSCRRSSPHCEPQRESHQSRGGGGGEAQPASRRLGQLWRGFGHCWEDGLTLKMTRMFSPRGSTFWKESFRGTALELK